MSFYTVTDKNGQVVKVVREDCCPSITDVIWLVPPPTKERKCEDVKDE